MDVGQARRRIASALRDAPGRRIGVELEWLVFDREDLGRVVSAAETAAAGSGNPLPGGGTVSVEPGGQLELSTRAGEDLAALCEALACDVEVLRRRLEGHGLLLATVGLDPLRSPRPTLRADRYVAMERYFARRSPAGVRMMTSTAAFQVSIDPGPTPLIAWRRLAVAAPVLGALFANSPVGVDGAPGCRSARQGVWADTDPCRTAPVPTTSVDAWVAYAMDAQVMLRRTPDGITAQLDDLSFGGWLSKRSDRPDEDDLAVHLSTLFPPIRPRGNLELRVIDSIPRAAREAAVAITWALVHDDRVAAGAVEACEAVPDAWRQARTSGLDDTAIRDAASACLLGAAEAMTDVAPTLGDACLRLRSERVVGRPDVVTDPHELVLANTEPAAAGWCS